MGLLPVALAAEFDDVGVTDQPVDGGDGHHVVEEDASPGAERPVGGDLTPLDLAAVGGRVRVHRVPRQVVDVLEAQRYAVLCQLTAAWRALDGSAPGPRPRLAGCG